MSTDYTPRNKAIPMEDLFDGRLETYGITEQVIEGTTSVDMRCLSDGRNWLWVYGDEFVHCMSRFRIMNCPGKILWAIEDVFQTEIFSENQPQFWGYETQEEWDEAQQEAADESEAKFYVKLVKYINGDPKGIGPGTNGMLKAEIAKELVAGNPDLLEPRSKSDLMKLVDKIYSDRHCVTVTLTEEEIATVKLGATHEDDLSFA